MKASYRRASGFALFVAVVLIGAAVGIAFVLPLVLRPSTGSPLPFASIQHVVVVMMENHAYDNLFGRYCPLLSAACPQTADGLPANVCMPYNPSATGLGCVRPFNLTKLVNPDMPHSWNASHVAFANGSMNGFYLAEETPQTMGTYNASTVPVYWDIAQKFGLADGFFSSTLSYSTPNHWYLIAGSSPQIALTSALAGIHDAHLYLNESNQTNTVEQELGQNPQVSWKWYDWPLTSYAAAINMIGVHQEPGTAYSYWNVLAGKYQSYDPEVASHFADRSTFFNDVANGSLPDVSWMIPGFNFSDHNPANLSQGQDWIASIVNSVERSPYWNSTAIMLSWDDYGGYYDHVAPTQIDPNGYGFRTPLLVVSPWTAPGLVVHSPLQFESILHLIEWRWGLGCLTSRDCNAPLPTEFFNFSLHRDPVYLPQYSQAVYPYVAPAGVYTGASGWNSAAPANASLQQVD